MFEKINSLDQIGLYKQADKLEKTLIAVNNFSLTKKQVSPARQINTKLDVITSKLHEMEGLIDDQSYEDSNQEVNENDI